jgi:acetoin:2,6-dichlorophenolindophenol oxidoreductase subunit alpha
VIGDIPKNVLLTLYQNLVTARLLEDKFLALTEAGDFGKDEPHRGTAEEAVPIGICANLRKDDYIKTTTRTRHCLFAKGLSIRDIIASKMFRDLKSVGGHYSYYDYDYGIIPYSGTLGEDVMIATGAALAEKIKKSDKVSVAIYGDGTASRGSIHESMIFAAYLKLPMIFVVQNNQYAMGTSVHKTCLLGDLSERALGYGFPGVSVDGNDIIAVYETAKKYIDRARQGGGPALIVAETYRLFGHYDGDPQAYRPKGEGEEWAKRDPIPRLEKQLIERSLLTPDQIAQVRTKALEEIEQATAAARALPSYTKEHYLQTAVAEL